MWACRFRVLGTCRILVQGSHNYRLGIFFSWMGSEGSACMCFSPRPFDAAHSRLFCLPPGCVVFLFLPRARPECSLTQKPSGATENSTPLPPGAKRSSNRKQQPGRGLRVYSFVFFCLVCSMAETVAAAFIRSSDAA